MDSREGNSAIYERRELRLQQLRVTNTLLCLVLLLVMAVGFSIYFYAPSISAFQEEYQSRKAIEYLESTKLILERAWFSNNQRKADIKELGRLINLLTTECHISDKGPEVTIEVQDIIDDPERVQNIFKSFKTTAENGGEQFHLLIPNGDRFIPISVPPETQKELRLNCTNLVMDIYYALSALKGLSDDIGGELFSDLTAGKYKSLEAINENIRFYEQMLKLRGEQPAYLKNLQTYTNIRLWTGITTVLIILFILSIIRGNVAEQRSIQSIILGMNSENSGGKVSDDTITEIIEKLRDHLLK